MWVAIHVHVGGDSWLTMDVGGCAGGSMGWVANQQYTAGRRGDAGASWNES